MEMFHQDAHQAGRLLTSACEAFHSAEETLDGQLERDVEQAAAKCWALRDKSVQVKGRLFRTKTLILEEPVFQHDAEQQFGEVLARWQEGGEVGVGSAALTLKVAEQRLLYTAARARESADPEALLQLVEALVVAWDSIDAVSSPKLADTQRLVRDLALQTGLQYLQGSPATTGSSSPLARLASVLASHSRAAGWTAALLQLPGTEVLPVLQALTASPLQPAAVQQVLAQCNWSGVPEQELPAVVDTLLHLAPTAACSSDSAALELCVLLQRVITSLAQRTAVATHAAAAALPCLLMAVSKAIPPADLASALGINAEQLAAPMDLATSATWIFGPLSNASTTPEAVQRLVADIDWRWAAEVVPPALRLRWLLAAVAAAKALARGGSDGGTAAVNGMSQALSGRAGWMLCQLDAAGADEAYMLCMLEAPPADLEPVQSLWMQVQAGVALALCTSWLAAGDDAAAGKVQDLLAGAQISEKMDRLCRSGQATACVSLVGCTVELTAGIPDFSSLRPLLSHVFASALGSGGDQQPAVDAVAAAAARAVTAALQETPPAAAGASAPGSDLSAQLEALSITSMGPGLAQGTSPAVDSTQSNNASATPAGTPFAALCFWLGAVLEVPVRGDELSEAVQSLLGSLTQSCYYLLGSSSSNAGEGQPSPRLATLASAMLDATAALTPVQAQQLASALVSLQQPWLSVLAAWVGDASVLRSMLLAESAATVALSQALVQSLQAMGSQPGAPSDVEVAAEEIYQLQEAVKVAGESASPAVLPLWHEYFVRVCRHRAALSELLPREDILIQLKDASQQYSTHSSILAGAAAQLTPFLAAAGAAPESAAPLPQLLPFVGSADVADELARIDASWREWIQRTSGVVAPPLMQLDEPQGPSAPPAAAAMQPPTLPRAPPVDAATLNFLSQLQQQQGEDLQEAAALLRFWARRGEKQAARPLGEAPDPAQGREGDVPSSVAAAQAVLWDGSRRWSEGVAQLQAGLRQRVCQRFLTIDEAVLQSTAEVHDDGARIAAQTDPRYGQQCRELRQRTREAVADILEAKEVAQAAAELFKTEYLLLHREASSGDGPGEGAKVKSQLLSAVAQAIVEGSTPPVAAPYLTALFERAVTSGAAALSTDARLQLLPQISRAMRPGGGSNLREKEAMTLLRAALDPDALLDEGRLREFLAALQLVLRMCSDPGGAQALPMLSGFDAQRFAILAAEQAGQGGGEAGGSSTLQQVQAKGVTMQQVLSLAADCFAQPGAEATGGAVVEGILGLAPAAYYAACLGAVLSTRGSHARDATLSMLSRIPVELLSDGVVAEALDLLTEALNSHCLAPPSVPYDLLAALHRSAPVLAGVKRLVQDPDALGSTQHSASRAASWTVRIGALSAEAAGPDGAAALGGGGSSSTAAASGAAAEGQPAAGAAAAAEAKTAGSRVVILPVPTSHPPFAVLLEALVRAVLDSMLRTLGSGLDGGALCGELEALLGVVLEMGGQQGAWALHWLWQLFQDVLQPFLLLAAGASDGATNGLFQQYWGSLPWSQASFHTASPKTLAQLRAYLPSADRAAIELLHCLDWAVPLAKAQPAAGLVHSRSEPVFSLGDEEEQEALQVAGEGLQDEYGSALWSAELGLLMLHAGVLLTQEALPAWMHMQLHGTPAADQPQTSQQHTSRDDPMQLVQGVPMQGYALPQQPWQAPQSQPQPQTLLPAVLAAADWIHIQRVVTGQGVMAPWLLLPALLAPHMVAGDVGARITHAARLLSQGALAATTALAASTAAAAIRPLIGLSICQGVQIIQQQLQATGRAGTPVMAAAGPPPEGMLHIPDDIPPELLEGTVELHMLQLQQQEQALREEEATLAAAAAAAAAAASLVQPRSMAMVEVAACFRLTAALHAELVEHALMPLAQRHASIELARSLAADQCPPFEPPLPAAYADATAAEAPAEGGASASASASSSSTLQSWQPPLLASLVGELPAGGAGGVKAPGAEMADAVSEAALKVATIAALLQGLVDPPLTLLLQERLPFANADVPWDLTPALFITTSGQTQPAPAERGSLRALRRRLAALLRTGREVSQAGPPPDTAAELNSAVTDLAALRHLVATVVDDVCSRPAAAPLAACLLRTTFVCETLQGLGPVTQLSENLLRHLASPSPAADAAAAAGYEMLARGSQRHGSAASFSSSAPEVPVVTVGVHGATVTQVEGAAGVLNHSDSAALGQPAAAAAEVDIPASMQYAVAAASGLGQASLLTLARSCAALKRPLLAAFALAQLRRASTALEKFEWQVLVEGALRVVVGTDFNADHPMEVAAVWLEAINWLNDSRWRRLPPGPHKQALMELLGVLDARVMVLTLDPDEEWEPSHSHSPGSPRGLLAAAAGRVRKATAHPGQLTGQLGEGIKSLAAGLGKDHHQPQHAQHVPAGAAPSSTPLQAEAAGPLPISSQPPTFSPLAQGGGEFTEVSLAGPPAAEDAPGVGAKLSSGFKSFGKQLTSARHKLAARPGTAAGEDRPWPSSAPSSASPSRPPAPKTAAQMARQQAAQQEADTLVRIGLLAFTVAAYIRSVMEPRLARRTTSGMGSLPGSPYSSPGHSGRRTSHARSGSGLTGARVLEEQHLQEMDTVLEARSELDALSELAGCPLLQGSLPAYVSFMAEVPRLLTVATAPGAFQVEAARLLLGEGVVQQVLVVARA